MADNGEHVEFDATQQQLGAVYAKALLGAAASVSNTQLVLEEFDSLVGDVLDELPQFEAALQSPRIPHEEKVQMLDKAFQGKMKDELLRFLKVVSSHGRMDCLREIHRAAHKLFNEQLGRMDVRVTTAAPIDQGLADSIAKKLSESLGGDVVMKTEVDESLLGGIQVRVGDTVYDASVANRLRRMRETTLEQTTQSIRNSLDRFSQ
ncbi:MAG: ATP synthase F1 subunit delta [Pirellulaceae bacterium]|jgi:F-type H+-transporting ATPase subunit delta|nr:ATP synthase F1 subunit delta [Pirellulaceae bacterium]MDP7015062.1 ATP synthase F1 subunit delta [Pirellulaceae bacterium]